MAYLLEEECKKHLACDAVISVKSNWLVCLFLTEVECAKNLAKMAETAKSVVVHQVSTS